MINIGKKTAIIAVIVSIIVILAAIWILLLRQERPDYMLIVGTTPIHAGSGYKYSVMLQEDPPYYQTFSLQHNYSLKEISIFIIQFNKSIDLQLTLSEFDPGSPFNYSNVSTIGSLIVSGTKIKNGSPIWVDVEINNIKLTRDKYYKITLAPYPEQGGESYLWFVSNDTYPNGQLYCFTEDRNIKGPLDMGTDAAFRLWGVLDD